MCILLSYSGNIEPNGARLAYHHLMKVQHCRCFHTKNTHNLSQPEWIYKFRGKNHKLYYTDTARYQDSQDTMSKLNYPTNSLNHE